MGNYESLLSGPEDVAILGLGLLNGEELDGLIEAVAKMPRSSVVRRKFNHLTRKGHKGSMINAGKGGEGVSSVSFGKDSRTEVLKRLDLLPEEYRKGLMGKKLRIADVELYQSKILTQGIIDMFTTGDVATPGIGNVSQAVITNNRPFLVTAIQFITGPSPLNNGLDAAYAIAPSNVLNGEWYFTVAGLEKVAKTPNKTFDTTNRTDRAIGAYVVDNPFWVLPNAELKLPVNVVAAFAGGFVNPWGKVILHGAQISEN